MSPLQFRAAARKLQAQHKCKLLIVDYLQLMDPGGSGDESRERQVAACSRTIKSTAMELGIPIVVLAQLNDWGRSRESRAIEQDSDLFVVIEEDKDSLDPEDMFIRIKLGRGCPKTKIPVAFRGNYVKFEPRAQ
jgi:replicative DNA helicase